MESKNDIDFSNASLMNAMELFFKERSFGEIQNIFFKLFQCWGVKECHKRMDLSNADVALFYDQLQSLLGEVYLKYQATKSTGISIEDNNHE